MKLVWPATMPMKVAAPMPSEHQDHGKEVGVVDMLLGAKADGKGAAGGDQARAWVTQPDTEDETDGHGKNKDEIGTKGLRSPIEDEAVGEEGSGGNGGGC